MKKRYLTLATLLAAGICLTFGVIAILPPRPGVTKANLNRIKVGMTKAEVETLLGKSTDSFTECTCSDRKSEAHVDLRFNADDVLVSMHIRDDTPLDKASANFKLRLTQLREGMKLSRLEADLEDAEKQLENVNAKILEQLRR